MIAFEKTDLKIIELETEDGGEARLYLLIETVENTEFDMQKFIDDMDKVMPLVDRNPNAFDQMLDRNKVLEIFDEEDIEELIDEGVLDPEDLHQSVYEFYTIEQSGDNFDINSDTDEEN
jgi:hypothetical protein